MAHPELSAAARAVVDRYFPEFYAKSAADDPELAAFFDTFAYDEVLRHTGELSERTRMMTLVAATIAVGSTTLFRLQLGAALTAGVTPAEAKEIVYQAVPYVGMARAVEFVAAANEALAERGVQMPLPGQSTTTPDTRQQAGLAVQKKVFGDALIDANYANAPADERHIQELLSANCFGDYYTRTGLDLPTRELLTFIMLVALGGADAQVRAHAAGNVAVGNGRAILIATLTGLLPFIGYPRTLNGLAAVNQAAPAPTKP